MSELDEAGKKGRRQFLMMVALFFAPLIIAIVIWNYVSEHGVMSTVNAGTLVTPARPMLGEDIKVAGDQEDLLKALSGRWTYIIFTRDGCDEQCQKQVYVTRQIRLGVNKDMRRVQRILVANGQLEEKVATALSNLHPEMMRAIAGEKFAEQFVKAGFDASGQYFFLVDPLGNLMMAYTLDLSGKAIMKDLQKLLKINVVG